MAAAQAAQLPLAVALTVLCMETGGGANIWGHDHTPVPDTELPYVKGGPVTAENYAAYKAARDRIGSQGVGPTQLTWHGFQDRADELGGCWRPEVNMRVGFSVVANYIIAGYLRDNPAYDAYSIYNTGKPGQSRYANQAVQIQAQWERVLTA